MIQKVFSFFSWTKETDGLSAQAERTYQEVFEMVQLLVINFQGSAFPPNPLLTPFHLFPFFS